MPFWKQEQIVEDARNVAHNDVYIFRNFGKPEQLFDNPHCFWNQTNTCPHIWNEADTCPPRKRALLTDDQAAEIFSMRVPSAETSNALRNRALTSRSVAVSKMYGVSPKAVRDIWNKRTWRHATRALWTETDELQYASYLKDGTIQHQDRSIPKNLSSSGTRPRSSKVPKACRPLDVHTGLTESLDNFSHFAPLSHGVPASPPGNIPFGTSGAANDYYPAASYHDWKVDEDQDADAEDEDSLLRHFPFFLHLPPATPRRCLV